MKAYYLPLLLLASCAISHTQPTKKPLFAKQTNSCSKKETSDKMQSCPKTITSKAEKLTPPNAKLVTRVEKLSVKPDDAQVTICNNIDRKKDTTYKWCFISYTPNKFSFKVNGQEVEPGKELSIPADETFLVRYDYEFAGGKRKGSKEIQFKRNPNAQKLDMRFSWNNEWRVMFKDNGATPIKVTQTESK